MAEKNGLIEEEILICLICGNSLQKRAETKKGTEYYCPNCEVKCYNCPNCSEEMQSKGEELLIVDTGQLLHMIWTCSQCNGIFYMPAE